MISALMWLGVDWPVYLLAAVEICLFIVYSIRPARLKESFLGIIVDALYAHVVPFVIVALVGLSMFFHGHEYSIGILYAAIVWQFTAGIRGIASHQMSDLLNDIRAGVDTAVVTVGAERTANIHRYILVPIELTTLLVVLVLCIDITIVPLAGYVIYSAIFMGYHARCIYKNIAHATQTKFWDVYFDVFYRGWLAIALLVPSVIIKPEFLLILCLHLVLFGLPGLRRRCTNIVDARFIEYV